MAHGNGTGQGGKSFNDRILAASVRTKTLEAIKEVLEGGSEVTEKWSDYKKNLVLKLSSSILPRLNEHTGADGAKLTIGFDPTFNGISNSSQDTTADSPQ